MEPDEIKLDYKLDKKELFHISGYVYSLNIPIKNACVKITSSKFEPLFHVYTDCNGYFTLTNNIPKLFRIIVCKDNYEIFSSNIILRNKSKCPIKINLKEKISKNIVLGKIVNINEEAIKYANISIKELDINTISNEKGEFILENLKTGCWTLNISSSFYYTSRVKIHVVKHKKIYELKPIFLREKPFTGTVNGVIYNSNNRPIKTAIVMLINEETNKIIDYTYTNEMGVYLFGNVPRGKYYIKANK